MTDPKRNIGWPPNDPTKGMTPNEQRCYWQGIADHMRSQDKRARQSADLPYLFCAVFLFAAAVAVVIHAAMMVFK